MTSFLLLGNSRTQGPAGLSADRSHNTALMKTPIHELYKTENKRTFLKQELELCRIRPYSRSKPYFRKFRAKKSD